VKLAASVKTSPQIPLGWLTPLLSLFVLLEVTGLWSNRSDEVEAMRLPVKSHMAGWMPEGAETPLDYSHSEISSISGGFVWVNVFFNCRYLMSV
jgi:hypothetical protein